MGTPEFAVPALDVLVKNGYEVAGVVTAPDRPAGRGQQLHQSAVKQYALRHNLKLLQPEKLKDEDFIDALKALKADLQIVVAFRMLPEVVWNMPPLGTYNLHASLLPKYRGAAPINWAIINGEKETGVTTFKLKHEIDTGNILFRQSVAISDTTTAGELHDELMHVGSALILKTANEIANSFSQASELRFIPQDDVAACHAPKIFKETCRISWSNTAADICNLIRGLSPYPAAFAGLKNGDAALSVKIFNAAYSKMAHGHTNGSVSTDNKTFLNVYCSDGIIEIKDLQLEGKKRMPVTEFLKGFKFGDGFIFI